MPRMTGNATWSECCRHYIITNLPTTYSPRNSTTRCQSSISKKPRKKSRRNTPASSVIFSDSDSDSVLLILWRINGSGKKTQIISNHKFKALSTELLGTFDVLLHMKPIYFFNMLFSYCMCFICLYSFPSSNFDKYTILFEYSSVFFVDTWFPTGLLALIYFSLASSNYW